MNQSIAYNFNYGLDPAPEESLLEDALDLPDITNPAEVAETAAEAAIPEARAVGLASRLIGALRRALPW